MFRHASFFLLLTCWALASAVFAAQSPGSANIVLILTDDQRCDTIGAYHGRQVWDEQKGVTPAQHVDDYCVDRSIAFVEEAARRPAPFVLFHATQLPNMDSRHTWPSPQEFRARYDSAKLPLPSTFKGDLSGKPPYLMEVRNRTKADKSGCQDPAKIRNHIRDYYAVITQMDAMIGRLLGALDRLSLMEKRRTKGVAASASEWTDSGSLSESTRWRSQLRTRFIPVTRSVQQQDVSTALLTASLP